MEPDFAYEMTEELIIEESAMILIVDDGKENREFLRKNLGAAGFEIETATCGKEALEKIKLPRFDLALLDIILPDMSGAEVLTAIREIYTRIELPVLMVIPETQTDSVVEVFALGANDYLTKPFDFRVVLARSKTHLALKKTEEKIIATLSKEKELAALRVQFLTMASHEFRTPLTVIMSASDILKKYSSRMQEQEKNESLDTIQEQVNVLTDLLDEFMAVAEKSGDKPEFNLEQS